MPSELSFSLFDKPVTNLIPKAPVSFGNVYDMIVSDTFRASTSRHRLLSITDRKKNKAVAFDYVTFNAVCASRNDSESKPSGAFVVDIDDQNNLTDIKAALAKDVTLEPALIFTSPSGEGLKMVLKIDPAFIDMKANSVKMAPYWNAVNNYLRTNYANLMKPDSAGNFIDQSGKDLSRACFLCSDPDAYRNLEGTTILGQNFITENQQAQPQPKPRLDIKKVNPRTTLRDLDRRHLADRDNHTPELLAFTCASIQIGADRQTVTQYITENVSIADDSTKADPERLDMFLKDLFKRYGPATQDIIQLTPLQFAKGILSFKHSKEAGGYMLTGLYYEGVRQFLQDHGFAKRYTDKNSPVYIKINDCVISEITVEIMRDCLTQYVETFVDDLAFEYQNIRYQIPFEAIRETYLRNSNNIFNEVWMEHLQTHTKPLLKDSKTETHLFFRNALVTVTSAAMQIRAWSEISDYCVWENQLIPRDFEYNPESLESEFGKFLFNVNNKNPGRFAAMRSAIGYLMNYDFRPSGGQAVIFYDEEITDTKAPQGGSGKGLIMNGVKQVKNVQKIDGKHLDPANQFKFEEVTPGTQVIWLDDVKHDFDFSMLYSNLTDGWTIERKHKSKFQIPVADSPKVAICSNAIIKAGGSSTVRRQFVFELADHYSSQIIYGNESPIEKEHGGLFFSSDWSNEEWNKFFSFMIDCAKYYLENNIILQKVINVEINRLKQSTNDDFVSWCESKGFAYNVRHDTKSLYMEFVSVYYGTTAVFMQRTFTNWMKAYAGYLGCEMVVGAANGHPYFILVSKGVKTEPEPLPF